MPYRLISQEMLLEHEVLARLSDALRTAVGWNQHGDQAQKLSSVKFLAESFERHLERMLELEEQNGYMDAVETNFPQFRPQVADFRRQHGEFRRWIGDLLTRLGQNTDLASSGTDLLFEDLSSLLDQIDRHNKQEMGLLQEVILHHQADD
jgi:hemerythrin-like domain-containing protein